MSIYKNIESVREVDLNGTVTEYACKCPFCAKLGKKTDGHKLGISLTKGVYHCYRCGSKGSVDYLLRGVIPNKDIMEFKFRDISENKEQLLNSELIDYDSISIKIDSCCFNAVSYLKNRGIGEEQIKKYDIRIGKGIYHDRLTIPVYDDYGNCVYLTARDYQNKSPNLKYLNPTESHKSLCVWNLNNAHKGDNIILTEGVFSGMSADMTSSNFVGICIFGKVISDQQAKMIGKKELGEVVLSFDGDVSDKEIKHNYDKLRLYHRGKITILKLIDNEDPNSVSQEVYYKRLVDRKSLDDYLMSIN